MGLRYNLVTAIMNCIHGTTKSPRPTPITGYGKCFLFSHLYASGQVHLSTPPLTWDQALFSFRFLNKILALPGRRENACKVTPPPNMLNREQHQIKKQNKTKQKSGGSLYRIFMVYGTQMRRILEKVNHS